MNSTADQEWMYNSFTLKSEHTITRIICFKKISIKNYVISLEVLAFHLNIDFRKELHLPFLVKKITIIFDYNFKCIHSIYIMYMQLF